jgi:hypothetical protein
MACKKTKKSTKKVVKKSKKKVVKATVMNNKVVEPRIVKRIRQQATTVAELGFANEKLNKHRDKIASQMILFADAIIKSFDADAKSKVKSAEKAKRDEVRLKRRAELDAKRDIRDAAKQDRHEKKSAKKREKIVAMRLALAKAEAELDA